MTDSLPEALPLVAPRPHHVVTALHDHAAAERLADLATQALLDEVLLAPKPGLVDPTSTGAHQDMDVETFRASVEALRPWFPVFHETGRAGHQDGPRRFLERLRRPGRLCEDAMLAATGGVNTHKGAVFAFGLLLGCAGRLSAADAPATPELLCHLAARTTAGLVRDELAPVVDPSTYGERAFRRHGLTGARGQAASGYRVVLAHALPAHDAALARTGDGQLARLQALLVLMARTDDTTLVKRGDLSGMAYVQAQASALLADGGALAPDALARLRALDRDLTARRLSPGGCADLLAVTCFLAALRP